MSNKNPKEISGRSNTTKHGDFVVSVLVLFAKVMKADGKLLKSEIEYIKRFLKQQFGTQKAKELMIVFREILDQNYPLKCMPTNSTLNGPP